MLEAKIAKLRASLARLPGAVVAYSGGADSAFLAEESHGVLGARALAVIADSPSLARRELQSAVELAQVRGWQLEIIHTRELDDERYRRNQTDRCYFCKSELFESIGRIASASGSSVLLGTNTDDLGDWRPGLAAASEHGALHPLVDAGLSKSEVREASRRAGLPTFDKPASACLSSRIAYGVPVTEKALGLVERAEQFVLGLGFRVVRVRLLDGVVARVEVSSDEVSRLMTLGSAVTAELTNLGFSRVLLDPEGYRTGRLNEGRVPVLAIGKSPPADRQ